MVTCAVASCRNDSRRQTKKKDGISFHRFPQTQEMMRKWVVAIKRPKWKPNIQSHVCSIHFDASSISESRNGLRKLVEGAIPSLHIRDKNCLFETILIPSKREELMTSESYDLSSSETMFGNLENIVVESTDRLTFADYCAPEPNDSLIERRLKHQLNYFKEIAKRRRKCCNALYVTNMRLRKKIAHLSKTLQSVSRKKTPSIS